MKIKDIFRRGEISNRTRNICISNHIETFKDLKQHYKKNKTFRNIPFCGKVSEDELIEVYNKYKDADFENETYRSVSKYKGAMKLEDVVTDLHDVMKTTLTKKAYLKLLEMRLQEHWRESADKETTDTDVLEEIEKKLQDHWSEETIKPDEIVPDVIESDESEAAEPTSNSPDEIEQEPKKHASGHKEKDTLQYNFFPSSINLISNVMDVIDFEEIQETLKNYKVRGKG